VRRPPGGDDHRVDGVGGDQVVAAGQGLRGRQLPGHGGGAIGVRVGDGDHAAAPRASVEPADVLLADHADPDDPDVQRHDALLDSSPGPLLLAASGSRLWPPPQRRQRRRTLEYPSRRQEVVRAS
jgi:hypothetical protein